MFLKVLSSVLSCIIHSLLSSFADETRITRAISCVKDTALLQQDLLNVSRWSQENSMVLHEKKFELLCHLSNKDSTLHQLPFTSELYEYSSSSGVAITPSTYVKDLGVIISSDLTWHRHITSMVDSANKMSSWALSLFQDRSKAKMLTLYKSLIRCRVGRGVLLPSLESIRRWQHPSFRSSPTALHQADPGIPASLLL